MCPAAQDMDQETARHLLATGAVFVLEGLPLGSEFGIDMNVYSVGPKFRGVKMIPPGIHFVYFSSLSEHDRHSLSPRSGFFKFFAEKEMCVRKWDSLSEDLDTVVVSQEEEQRYRDNLIGSLDQFLAPYDFSTYEKWSGLTDHITPEVLNRLNPTSGRIYAAAQLIPQPFLSRSSTRMRETDRRVVQTDMSSAASSSLTSEELDKLLPHMETDASSLINFTPIEKTRHAAGCAPADVTKHSLDSSLRLESVIKCLKSESDAVLAEVQFAFVCFLIGHVYDAFSHWKDIMNLICSANQALEHYDSLYLNFIRVLHFQVQEVPADLFVDIVNSNNFLLVNLRDLFFNLENNESVSSDLRRRGRGFRASLEKRFKWDFNVENSDDDEAPVVLQLDD